MDILTKVRNFWDTASSLSDLQEARWGKNQKLIRSQHLTPRKPGRSSLFIPKIEGFLYRKTADYVANFAPDEGAVSLSPMPGTSDEGARILEKAINMHLETSVKWPEIIYNAAQNGLTYNFAPAELSWERDVEEYEENGETLEREIYSRPVIDVYPPEDVRIDPSVTWDTVDKARYMVFRVYKDKAYAQKMAEMKIWPEIPDSLINIDHPNSQLKTERDSNTSPFKTDLFIDNGLIEIWKTYYIDDEGEAVLTVTLKDQLVLEEPEELEVPLGDLDGDVWPFVIGVIHPEPHSIYARAMPEKLEQLQVETNAIRNQRRDNVGLILNREKLVTPEAGIDPAVLAVSYAGKVTQVNDLNAVRWDAPPDVTSSAYNEENIAVNDMERLVAEGPQRMGGASQRKETATADMIKERGSDAISGLDMQMFNRTFSLPLIKKLVRMMQLTESPDFLQVIADDLGIQTADPLGIIQGEYRVKVGSGAERAKKEEAIATANNLIALLMGTFGPAANYVSLIKPVLDVHGIKLEDILPQQSQVDDSGLDMGGMIPGGSAPVVNPRINSPGGQFSPVTTEDGNT